MSLDYNLNEIHDYKNVCWETVAADEVTDELRTEADHGNGWIEDDGSYRRMNPITHALIWMTMSVGIGKITHVNKRDFFARMRIWEKVYGTSLMKTDDDGKRADRPITYEEVEQHVGLGTNVSNETDAKWRKRFHENATLYFDRQIPRKEKSDA